MVFWDYQRAGNGKTALGDRGWQKYRWTMRRPTAPSCTAASETEARRDLLKLLETLPDRFPMPTPGQPRRPVRCGNSVAPIFRVCGQHWHSPRPTGPRQAREAEGMKADALISILATDPTAVDASAVTRRISAAAAAAGLVLQQRANDYPSTSPRLAPVINANSPQAANSVGHPLTCIPMRLGSRANLIKVHIANGSCRLSST